ncbi:MAG: hypothetical protein SFW09_01845 [Hyphomicrobiaceae bacterium]|nr:hypothetical protein [Hyphomicrobiaceae bacterium]
MLTQTTDQAATVGSGDSAAQPPRVVRWVIVGSVGALLLGATYLIAVRGEALLVDLAKLGAALCF